MRPNQWKRTILWICIVLLVKLSADHQLVHGKYVEGHLKTHDDWAFVARFCFLSGRGRYEYHIEYEKRLGEPQLLLYYDDESQWPSVYKTDKSCLQKVSVLSVLDNQVVTLSSKRPASFLSGCRLTTSRERLKPPPPSPSGNATNNSPENVSPTASTASDEEDFSYFEQFLKSSTSSPTSGQTTTTMPTTTFADNWATTTTTMFDDDPFAAIPVDNETELFTGTFVPLPRDNDGLLNGNRLENDSSFQADVEELFSNSGGDDSSTEHNVRVRVRRTASPSSSLLVQREKTGTIIVSCSNAGGFTTVRERWWYIAIANCGSDKGIDIKYRFRMTNGPPGDFWHEHFSADEMYIPPILLVESIIYTVLLLAIFLCAIELKTRHLFHCTYRLFAFSASMRYFGVLAEGVAWTKYAVSGLGPYTTMGDILGGISEISFLALMLLLAKGYTITRARLSTCTTVKLTVFINIYIVIYITLFIYRAEQFDPGEVLNLYESPSGFGIIGLRVGSWAGFLLAISATLRKYPEKSDFYYPFGVLGSFWILGGPAMTVVGINVLDAWVRESVMRGASGAITFAGHMAFLWLTWPSRANKSFPYHVRTNHIGIAAPGNDGMDYPHHAYEPGNQQEESIIIPLSRRTEELISGVYNQYIIERELYGNNMNPISHISFPVPASAPPRTNSNSFEDNELDNGVSGGKTEGQESNTNYQLNSEWIDSGHPSIENTPTSPASPANSVKTTTTMTDQCSQTPTGKAGGAGTPGADDGTGNDKEMKNNPFLANSYQRPPHKVILEPLNHPVVKGSVPKHLFAAKSGTNSQRF